jgi:Ala-tRNA(Pro) deacylase
MNILTRCLNLLDQRGIHYARSIHEGSKAAPSQRLAQTVVYRGDNGFGMLVLQPDAEVDFGEVRRLMGLTETRLATESELDALFPDCEPDAIPPVGNLFDLPVLMDESLAVEPFLAFNPGTHRDVIYIVMADYHNLVSPLVASFAVKKTAPAQVSIGFAGALSHRTGFEVVLL